MSIALSSLFATSALAKAFDTSCNERAAKGATFAPLLTALKDAFALEVPAGTISAINYLNVTLFASATPVKLATGTGAKASGIVVVQALHQYAHALRAGLSEAKRETAPEVLPLPAWACPVAIAAEKQRKAEAKQAADNERAAAELAGRAALDKALKEQVAEKAKLSEGMTMDAGEEDDVEAMMQAAQAIDDAASAEEAAAIEAISAPAVDMHAKMLEAWAAFAPFITQGVMTASERDKFVKAIEMAVCAPDKSVTVTKELETAPF